MKTSLKQQVTLQFADYLELFCYEFYERLDDYAGVSLEDITSAVIEGLNDFHASIDSRDIYARISDANDDLEPNDEYSRD